MPMKDILVLGIGNLVLRDEGVGIHARRLPAKTTSPGKY